MPGFRLFLGLYRVGDCVMHLCPICNRHTINVLDEDDDDDDIQPTDSGAAINNNQLAEAESRVLFHARVIRYTIAEQAVGCHTLYIKGT